MFKDEFSGVLRELAPPPLAIDFLNKVSTYN